MSAKDSMSMAHPTSMASLKPFLNLIIIPLLCIQFSQGQAQIDWVNGGYWYKDSGLAASAIDSTIFTHLFCAFADLDPNTNQVTVSSECATFPNTVHQKNPSVITLLSIGGGSVDSSVFNQMASQPASRRTFINSSISLARASGYDGLDLDWEHLTMPSEMANMATLLEEWRSALDDEASSTGADRLILTAAVAVGPQLNPETRFPTEVIARNLDWVNVMAYDFYNPKGSSVTRSHAALFDPTGGPSGSSGISAWIDGGVPREQLVLVFPFYGYAYKLVNPNKHGLLAPAAGIDTSVGDPGDGTVAYSKIRAFINATRATVVYNSTYVTNYCYSGTTWIGYDDTQAIATKVSYAKNNRLFGYVAWHIGQDYNWVLSRQAFQAWGAKATGAVV